MIPGGPGWCLLVGVCALVPPATTQEGPEEDATPRVGTEELGYRQDGDPLLRDPQGCGITFHTPKACGPPEPPPASAARHQLDHLQNLLQDTQAGLRAVEAAAELEDNGTRYRDVIAGALPAIRGANRAFQERLDSVRRELAAHVAEADHPHMADKKEKLRKGVRVVAHMLRLTSHLAQTLDATSHRLDAELSRRLQSSAARAAATAEP
ncbi:uncharacterized protein LOC141967129 [Athene noctua]|uniref:uncharacterized protein LOC141967129 n=1 Tax=Athene noctua TaxID=126797 RepID=UPI003EBF221A